MRKDILIILCLFLIAFLIRATGVPNVGIYWDEGLYWFRTNEILANNWAPTAEVFEGPSPFLFYIRAVVTVLFGGELNTLRMISVIFGSLTVPMLYLFGKAMYDRKTGLLSALFLCFSAYHCLFSRVMMHEAFTLFFVTAFLYFFWRSQSSDKRKGAIYAIIAGVMIGVAIDAKYLPAVLIPAVLIYIFWTKKFSFRAFLDKRIILMLVFALLLFLPMLTCFFVTNTSPISFYFTDVSEERASVMPRVYELSLDRVFVNAITRVNNVLAWDAGVLNPIWSVFFKLSTISLFLITLFSYLPEFINREEKSSFLVISFFTLCLLLFVVILVTYYLIYLLPFYFLMLSHLIVRSFEDLDLKRRREKGYKNIFRVFIILLAVIMFFSYFITGAASPYSGECEHTWVKSAVEHIKTDINENNYEKQIIIGYYTMDIKDAIDYYAFRSNLNASTVKIFVHTNKYGIVGAIDFEMINKLKPDYLVLSEKQCEFLFKKKYHKKLFNDYRITFVSKTHHATNGFVLKRENIEASGLLLPAEEREGKISGDIFKRTVPSVMKVGKVYTGLVKVRNTGGYRRNFTVRVHSDKYTVFVEDNWREVTLDKASTTTLRFKIVPIREYAGELPITVDLLKFEEDRIEIEDSFTSYVYLIEK